MNWFFCRFLFSIQMPKPTVERSTAQAEEMRQQRNQEARQLIGSTVHNAKAIFAQNTAAGQLTSKMVKTAPVKPVRNSITRSVNQQQQQSPESDKTQQQQQQPPQQQQQSSSPPPPQPAQPPSESSETSESTEVASPAANNKFQQEPQMTTNDQHLEDDDSDPYSTIKRSPYTKVMPSPPPPSNSQIEANGNGQQTVEQTRHEPQPIEGTGLDHFMFTSFSHQPVAVHNKCLLFSVCLQTIFQKIPPHSMVFLMMGFVHVLSMTIKQVMNNKTMMNLCCLLFITYTFEFSFRRWIGNYIWSGRYNNAHRSNRWRMVARSWTMRNLWPFSSQLCWTAKRLGAHTHSPT